MEVVSLHLEILTAGHEHASVDRAENVCGTVRLRTPSMDDLD